MSIYIFTKYVRDGIQSLKPPLHEAWPFDCGRKIASITLPIHNIKGPSRDLSCAINSDCEKAIAKLQSDQEGLAAAFDLAAYEGYMTARVKKSVNHSRIIQSMRKTSISFLFRRHIGFSGSREDRKCVQSCNLTSIYSPFFVVLWE